MEEIEAVSWGVTDTVEVREPDLETERVPDTERLEVSERDWDTVWVILGVGAVVMLTVLVSDAD